MLPSLPQAAQRSLTALRSGLTGALLAAEGGLGLGRQAAVAATAARGYGSGAADAGDAAYHKYVDTHRPHEAPLHRNHHARHHGHGHHHERHTRSTGPSGEQLEAVCGALGVLDHHDVRSFKHNCHKLPVPRQLELLEQWRGVATHLQRLGLTAPTVGRLATHCPALFAFAAEERAVVLFSELMAEDLGLSAEEAADLLCKCPALANTKHVMPQIVKVVVQQLEGHK